MEIGTEISRKIRGAIKGKLQELGAYVDEELPDYIMVMVANKKTQEQMTDDLSLFLGSSTIKFTVWLHGVLEKLRSATSDPNSQKSTDAIIFESSMPTSKTVSGGSEDGMPDEPGLSISRTRVEHHEPPVSTSSLGQSASYLRQHSEEGSTARLTSAVKPLSELAPSEAIIDIQPNADDLIDEDLNFVPESPVLPRKKPTASTVYGSSRPSAALYRPPGSSLQHYSGTDFATRSQRLPQASVQPDKLAESQNCRPLETIQPYDTEGFGHAAEMHRTTTKSSFERAVREEESLRKRKLPSLSSVVKVTKFSSDGQEEDEDDDDEEEDDDRGSRPASLPSSVSVPAKPERRPTLPPCKQANKNLILKAISEAQESVSKTTNYTAVPQKQTVPVAPRTRLAQDDPLTEMIRAQNALSRSSYLARAEQPRSSYITQADLPTSTYLTHVESSRSNYLTPAENPRPNYLSQVQPLRESGTERLIGTHQRQELFSRLQLDPSEETTRMNLEVYEEDTRPLDSRSFILKRPKLSEEVAPQNQPIEKMAVDGVQAQAGRLIKSREALQPEKPASPKFIVTLDGVPSPPGYGSDQEEAMEYTEEGQQTPKQNSTNLDKKAKKLQVQPRITRQSNNSDGEQEDHCIPAKQKISERCKYWPACKNGDTCVYHHPTAPCKAFPKCRFAEKCLFIHPNCKYDAKCTKPDCPYTHASRRQPVLPAEGTASGCHVAYCRYDAQCTNPDCPYMHGSQLNPKLLPKPAPAASSTTQQCKFFPSCKKMECPFYHPKPCRYNTQCQRPDCTFYHAASSVPPRHALKWTRPQTSE